MSHLTSAVDGQQQQPSRKPAAGSTMNKLKTMFGQKKAAAVEHTGVSGNGGGSNPSSHTSSRANSPSHTPVSSPDLQPTVAGLPRQPSSSQILTTSKKTPSPAPSVNSSVQPMPYKRLVVADDGFSHVHHLKNARRQEKLGGMLREFMGGGKKVRDDAVSAMPEFLDVQESKQDQLSLMSGLVSQIQNGEREVGHVVNSPSSSGTSTPTSSSASLVQKYGKCQEVIGKGAYGIVRVAHKYDHATRREMLFAVKEFKKRPSEDEQNFSKRLASEFCISSSLHHPNIIHTLDLMKDARGTCCEVMEYCAGGDLYSLILASEGGLEPIEADCFFKQLMRGVVYMHSMGVAHCDLKPENLLLTNSGVVKISDFGNGECFRMAWEKEIHLSTGVCGSRPYIAPEQFRDSEYDPRAVDIWATGIIYMAMRTGSYLWQVATQDEDEFYRRYLTGRKQSNGYEPIERLKRSKCRNVIYSILDPIPSRRITGKQVLNSEWGRSIHLCEAAERGY